MLPELVALCRQSVKVARRSSIDGYGEIGYSTDTTYRARVTGKRRLVRNDRGEEVMSTHTIHFAGNPAIGAQDRITLSTGDVNSTETGALQPPILAVGRFADDLGRMATVVYLA